jgi:accessory gene regulator B
VNININKFIENNTRIDKDEKAIVKFGIDMMISTIMAFITAIIISAVLGMLKEGIIFLISIIVLRQYAGGYHTNSQRSCAVLSCVIYSAGLMVIKSYKIYNGIQIAICIVSVLIIYFLVDNANNELTKSERKYLRNKVRIFLSSEVVIFVLLLIKDNEYWSGIIAISMMIVAILVLAGFIENRIRG